MIRFIGIAFILLWLLMLICGIFLYLCSLILYCDGQYIGCTIDSILSIIFILDFIDNINQIPLSFYYIIHNHWKADKECPCCDGKGYDDNWDDAEVPCSYCDGKGFVTEEEYNKWLNED